jgi:hypothetical protein
VSECECVYVCECVEFMLVSMTVTVCNFMFVLVECIHLCCGMPVWMYMCVCVCEGVCECLCL